MKYLIDTHAFLWCVEGSNKLSETVKTIIRDENKQRYISMASLWEFSIKHSMGKLGFEGDLARLYSIIKQYDLSVLPILQPHLEKLIHLPFLHRDPFDRLLVATAQADEMTLLTADENIRKYEVSCFW